MNKKTLEEATRLNAEIKDTRLTLDRLSRGNCGTVYIFDFMEPTVKIALESYLKKIEKEFEQL